MERNARMERLNKLYKEMEEVSAFIYEKESALITGALNLETLKRKAQRIENIVTVRVLGARNDVTKGKLYSNKEARELAIKEQLRGDKRYVSVCEEVTACVNSRDRLRLVVEIKKRAYGGLKILARGVAAWLLPGDGL